MRTTGLLLVGIVAGGLALSACSGSGDNATPATQPTSTSNTTPAATTTTSASGKATTPSTAKPASGNVIGPNGYGKVKLGMSYADVKATGAIREPESTSPDCTPYELFTNGKSDGSVSITKARGVEAIGPILKAGTPEGVSVGTTVAKVKAAYPAMDAASIQEFGRGYTVVPGNIKAVYRIGFKNGVVETISLQYEDQTCYE